jgi:hypothetical protein
MEVELHTGHDRLMTFWVVNSPFLTFWSRKSEEVFLRRAE